MNYGKRKLPDSAYLASPDIELEVASSTETGKDDTVKRKFRNLNEKKRRDQFNLLISQLSTIVCLSSDSKKVDKTTILKQAIRFLDSHQESESTLKENVSYSWKPSFLSNDEFTFLMLEAMDCVTVTLDHLGAIKFLSDNAQRKLGLAQDIALQERLLSDYLADSSIVPNLLRAAKDQPNMLYQVEALVSSDPVNESGRSFQAVDLLCVPDSDTSNTQEQDSPVAPVDLYNCIMQLKIPSLSNEYIGPPECTFKGKYSLEWKILHLDNKSVAVLGHQPFEILGTSGYDYYHPEDIEHIAIAHKKLLRSGCCKTSLHRMCTKGQGWVWVQADLYMCYNQWNSKAEHIECIYTVPSKESVELYKTKGNAPETMDDTPVEKRARTEEVPSSSDVSAHIPSSYASDVFFPNLAQSNNTMRETEFGRQSLKTTASRLVRTEVPAPSLPSLPANPLTPVQSKLHQQLHSKYKTLEANLIQQQEALCDLLKQLNMVSNMRDTTSDYQTPPVEDVEPVYGAIGGEITPADSNNCRQQ